MISLKSELTRKLLNYFFMNSDDNLYVNELSRNLNLDKRNLAKKIRELEKEGILKSETRGNLRLYSVNKNFPLYNEYKNIALKTFGIESKLREILKKINGIKKAFLYGSYVRDKMGVHSDIDLLIVGSHDIIALQRQLNKLQKEIGREINSVSMDEREFKDRLKEKDHFISEILKRKYIEIIK